MEHNPRRRAAAARYWPGIALGLLLAACSGGAVQVQELMLDPGDFPDLAVSSSGIELSESRDGQPSARVELTGPDFVVGQSLVIFRSREEASTALGRIKGDQVARGATPAEPGEFQEVSGVLAEQRGGDETLSLFFVQDRALVRVTASGPNRRSLLMDSAEKSRVKAARQ